MLIHDLDTPTVVCDLDKLARNVTSYNENAKKIGIPLWSHTKSHKIPEIAHMQVNAGSIGICCQKVGEAEVMAAAGISNIIIPYNIVGATKVDRLLRLARRINLTVAVDSETTARGISEGSIRHGGEVHTLIELDTGSKRCGVQSPAAAQELARKLTDLPGINFQGVMTYPSRTTIKDYLAETVERITSDGIPVYVVSGGGTGADDVSKEIGCTETRAGSYVWEGMTRVKGREDLSDERCPLRIITTVISRPTSDRLIIDGGLKTFCSYPPTPYGYCVEHPDLYITGMSIEHGHVNTSESRHNFQVGDRLTWIPLHQEMALNLHDELVGYRGEQVEVVWPVLGRGKVK